MKKDILILDADFRCIQRMKHGDTQAIDEFVRKYYLDIFKYCQRRLSNQDIAKDLTQETFVRFFSHLSDYHHYGKVKNFLYVIARNLCKDHCVKENNYIYLEYDVPMVVSEVPSVDKITLETCINKLPEEFKQVIVLYYFQGLKLSEISKILDIGLPLVKYRLKRAKIQLKKEMEGKPC